MSHQSETETGDGFDDHLGVRVGDEEGIVDKRTKLHILNLRVEIDNDARKLFVDKQMDRQSGIRESRAVQYWSVSVKQYLRAIKRLWHSDSSDNQIRNVEKYWEEKVIDRFTLIPPDTDGYQFSLIAKPNASAGQLKRMLNLPPGEDMPRPEKVDIRGLNEVLTTETIGHTWTVYTDKQGAPPNWEQSTLSVEHPLPKQTLERAVEVADDFLQQAGIGFKIGSDLPSWGYDQVENAYDRDDVDVL